MKKCGNTAKKHPVASLYLAGTVLLALWMLLCFAADSFCYATGRLREQTVTPADTALYTLVNMTQDGEILTADTGDAQLLLQPGQRVRTLHLYAAYLTPGTNEMDLYYHLPGMGYSAKFRVWPGLAEDGGSWVYRLPLVAGRNLRLDIADQSGVQVRVEKIVLNERPAWYTYFIPSLWQLLWLAAVPGLLACGADWIRDGALLWRQRRKGNTT